MVSRRELLVAVSLMFTNLAIAGEESWITDVNVLASNQMEGRATASAGSEKSRHYITSRFSDIGLLPLPALDNYWQPFRAIKKGQTINGTNIVGQLKGSVERYIIVSAHYDHIGRKGKRIFNGADDNASGVAAMLWMAAQSKLKGRQCHLLLLSADAEEHGLLGARAFMAAGLLNKKRIFANLNLDMLSQPGGRDELLVSGNSTHPDFAALIEQVERASDLPMIATDERRRFGRLPELVNRRKVSDHAVFAEQGIPFLFLGVGRHNYYHTPRDTPDRIDKAFFAKTVNAAWLYLQELDVLCAKG